MRNVIPPQPARIHDSLLGTHSTASLPGIQPDPHKPAAGCFRPAYPGVQKLVNRLAVLSRTLVRSVSLDHAWIGLLGAGVAALIWFSLHLAAVRIFQVDECNNVFAARMVATGQSHTAIGHIDLFQFALALVVRGASRSIDLFTSSRFVMTEFFWLNLVLMVVASGERLLSRGGLIALAAAATLAPLWDYGFEIRHDSLLLTGLLLMWFAVRVGPANTEGAHSYFIIGALAVGLQFVAFKAFVYTVPISLAILVFPPPGQKAPRWKLALAWGLGSLGCLLVVRLAYGTAGLWDMCLATSRAIGGVSTSGIRFGPWQTLARLFAQTPLLLALTAAALIAVTSDVQRRGKGGLTWDGNLPECLLFLNAFAALLINPTPFPYNLVHLVPFAFILAFRYASALAKQTCDRATLVPVIAAVLLFAHLVPFTTATLRHLEWPNWQQDSLMRRAEDLTDASKDPVYDGIGMVPTRPIIHPHSFLHSFNIHNFADGGGLKLREMLAARPAAVFIPNYRTDGLPEADHAFVREHYVALADDFWVLGKVLPPGGGDFEVAHPGRYRISTLQGSDLAGTYPAGLLGLKTPEDDGCFTGTLDGSSLSGKPVELAKGSHRIESARDCQPTVVWVGPRLDRIHRVGQADHRLLFFNWY